MCWCSGCRQQLLGVGPPGAVCAVFPCPQRTARLLFHVLCVLLLISPRAGWFPVCRALRCDVCWDFNAAWCSYMARGAELAGRQQEWLQKALCP